MKNSLNDSGGVLQGKTVMVTGASSGIGRACALYTADAGAAVILSGRDKSRLGHTLAQMKGDGHLIVPGDITCMENLAPMVEEAVSNCGKIYGFVHAAGIQKPAPLSVMNRGSYEEIFSINVIAGFELARIIAGKKFSEPDDARFIFISSVMGIAGQRGLVGYCASKGAVIAGVKAMALELARKHIRVNAVLGGQVQGTGMSDAMFSRLSDATIQHIADMHPLGLGTPGDIAGAVQFLLSPGAQWITGAAFPVDGGYTAV